MVEAVAEADALERCACDRAGGPARQTAQAQHLGDVRERGEGGKQIVGLEHEADVLAAHARVLRFGQRGQA